MAALNGMKKSFDDPENNFLTSIAHLPPAEQQKKLWYWRLAQRQGIMEAEHFSDQFDSSGKPEYKVW